jgi:hypothetical protein
MLLRRACMTTSCRVSPGNTGRSIRDKRVSTAARCALRNVGVSRALEVRIDRCWRVSPRNICASTPVGIVSSECTSASTRVGRASTADERSSTQVGMSHPRTTVHRLVLSCLNGDNWASTRVGVSHPVCGWSSTHVRRVSTANESASTSVTASRKPTTVHRPVLPFLARRQLCID